MLCLFVDYIQFRRMFFFKNVLNEIQLSIDVLTQIEYTKDYRFVSPLVITPVNKYVSI